MKKIFLALLILISTSFAAFAQVDEPLPKGSIVTFDGFENGNYWIWAGFDWDQYGAHKLSNGANISKDWASEGRHSLELTMEAMTPESSKSASWFYDGTNDLTGAKYIVVDYYNPEDYVYNITAVFQCTDSWKWCQGPTYQVAPGEHTVVYDMTAYTEFLSDVRRITLASDNWEVYPKESHIYIDNIRFIK
ncbi:MAG: hypothetical protein K5786_09010 [Treponema sp.]|nr:hypothetical protein [Treponema sp.]